jgi:hypothetical protein
MNSGNNNITVTINGIRFQLDLKEEYFSELIEEIKSAAARNGFHEENNNVIFSEHLGVEIRKIDGN